jgi:putative transcriptional regulator
MELLRNRKSVMWFLILSELLFHVPSPNQKEIANKLHVTPQAISEYFKELVEEGFIAVRSRGEYEVTKYGIDWVSKQAHTLFRFSEELLRKVLDKTSFIVAVAGEDVREGDLVSLHVRHGLVFAFKSETQSQGTAVTTAREGEEIVIKPTTFTFSISKGTVNIIKVPNAIEGGSKNVNIERLKKIINENRESIVAAIGIEALISVRKTGIEPIFFGSKEVVIESAHHGVPSILVCVESEILSVIKKLEEEDIFFTIEEL